MSSKRGHVVLITGASSGIGRACAFAFAKEGVHVVGFARREARLAELQAEIDVLPQPHGDFIGAVGDVTDRQALDQACQIARQTWGRLDYLVANAGVGQRGALADADWQHLETLLRTNIDGVLHSIRAVVPFMREAHGGHILIISSVAYNLISPYAASYAASKAFVSSIADSVRIELKADDIYVTDFLVGRTATEFNEKRLGEGKRTASGIPTMSPEVVANAVIGAVKRPRHRVILRLFDRLLVVGNRLVPGIIGRLAERQYK